MRTFTLVWFGQLISLLGTAMTQFALTIWAWQETGQATALALVGFFAFAPTVLLSPLAGALVDRWNRKLVMMLSDLGAGLASLTTFVLFSTGQLELWHLYGLAAWVGAFSAFQFPAYSAAISSMVDKSQYARANGMLGVAESASGIAAPVLAGIFLSTLGISGILIIDIVSFSVALSILFFVQIAQPERSSQTEVPNLLRESFFGFKYIWQKKPLLHVQLVFLWINFTSTFAIILLAPFILAKTGNNELILGTVQSALGLGGLVGGILLTVWGGPKRKIRGVLLGMAFSGLFGSVLMGFGQSQTIWMIAAFLTMLPVPLLNGSNQAIWQSKVPLDIQGRVFATRRLIAQVTAPVSMLIAGPLADRFFEPAMQTSGRLEPLLSPMLGSGAGSGMAILFLLSGLLGGVVGLAAFLVPTVRNVEDLLPDHDET